MPTVSQMPSAQDSKYAKVTDFGVACSEPLYILPIKDGEAAGKLSCIFLFPNASPSLEGSSAPLLVHNFSGYISIKLAVGLCKRCFLASQSKVALFPMITYKTKLERPKENPSTQVL